VLGLFDSTDHLTRMQSLVYNRLQGENEGRGFGPQILVDERDHPTGLSRRSLYCATTLTLREAVDAIHDLSGLAIASHVDRKSFGLIGHLGFIPEGLALDAVEVSPSGRFRRWEGLPVVRSSDAHALADLGRGFTIVIAESPSPDELGKAIRGEGGRRVAASMQDLSLHILDVVENALAASAKRVEILIAEDTSADRLSLVIRDDGKGMDDETRGRALDPFCTTRTTRRVGLGLPLLGQAAREAGGDIQIVSSPGHGTTVRTCFRLSHPDLKPMGDLAETLSAILASRPELDLRFEYHRDSTVIAELGNRRANDEAGS